jgi:peptidoglycan hydrolase-like protein with peptidoglycan-binding domain
MSLADWSTDPRLRRILTHPDDDTAAWRSDLERFLGGDTSLTRKSAGEAAIMAVQRLMIFLGYSTASSGAFLVDGDFGRGTNRAVAQFQFEHGLTRKITRDILCYPCRWNTASRLITAIPDTTLTVATLNRMAATAVETIESGQAMSGDLEDAIFHLNALHKRRFLDCRGILARYGGHAVSACAALEAGEGITVRPEWVLAIIRQETAGVIRPRFEQHYLSRLNERNPGADLQELRLRSMSLGLGQIMGENHRVVGAPSAAALFTAPVTEQVGFIARFLRPRENEVGKTEPTEADFRGVARFYNGPGYESHRYHEKLARWFREFRLLIDAEGFPKSSEAPPVDQARTVRYSLGNRPPNLPWFRKKTRAQLLFVSEPFEIETQEGVMRINPDTVDDWDDGYYIAFPEDGSKPYAIAPAYVRANYEAVDQKTRRIRVLPRRPGART